MKYLCPHCQQEVEVKVNIVGIDQLLEAVNLMLENRAAEFDNMQKVKRAIHQAMADLKGEVR
jgi:hypothetical protein